MGQMVTQKPTRRKFNKVLVTGADGFIGSHLVEALVRAGYGVKAFVYYNSFNSLGWLEAVPQEVLDGAEIFTGDIRDPHGVKSAAQNCDAILHLAALIGIPFSYHSPDAYVDTNVRGSLNVLQAARELGIRKIVHTSTSEVYGSALKVPIDEEHPLQGQSPYSATKIGADHLALSFYRSFDLPVCVLRPFNTYGPRQSARAVIPTVISQIASGKRRIQLGSLHPTRDFSYVTDTVAGFVATLEADDVVGEVINLGSGFEISIAQTVELIARSMGAEVLVQEEPDRVRPKKSEVERLWADISKAKRLLDWNPEYAGRAGFAKGIAHTVAWFQDQRNLRGYKVNAYNV
jgi:NAD dependent epimerase/dehydratase